MASTAETAALATLTEINTRDMLEACGLQRVHRGRRLLACICRLPARRFAATVLDFDQRVQSQGLAAAAAWGMERFSASLTVVGAEHIPRTGPALFLANHPGITDTLALFTALDRDDLLTVAAVRPFLVSLAHMAQRLIFVAPESTSQLAVVRSVSRHLRQGGAVLTFPAGRIEPDPAVLSGAAAALRDWSASIDLLVRLAPAAVVVPVLVSGVLSPQAVHSPLTRIRRRQVDRERLAATLQIAAPRLFPVTVRVTVGAPLAMPGMPGRSGETAVTAAVVAAMQRLLLAQGYAAGAATPSSRATAAG